MDLNSFNQYKILKYSFMFFYGIVLHHYELLTIENRLKMFLVMVPIFKFFNWYVGTNKRPFLQIVYSLFVDYIMCFLNFYFIYPFFSNKLFAFSLFIPVSLAHFFEKIEFDYFPEGTYLNISRDDFLSKLMLPTTILAYAVVYMFIDVDLYNYKFTEYTFIFHLVNMIIHDFVFGVYHALLHKVDHLWLIHKIHHEYKLDNVNMNASYYADYFDSLGMVILDAWPILIVNFFGISIPSFLIFDYISTIINSHNKYIYNHVNQFYFFEYSLFDLTIGHRYNHTQSSAFHVEHHSKLLSHYSPNGVVPDSWISAIADVFAKMIKGTKMLQKEQEIEFLYSEPK